MAWNQPGNRGNDPWRGKDPNREVQAFVERLRGMFGGGSGSGGGRPGEAFNPLYLVVGLLVVWLLFSSFRLIDERERGVVLRFGEFNRMMEPGPNLKLPWPFETVFVVQAQQVMAESAQMLVLTRDENLVEIGYNVQFQIIDPERYLFGTRGAEDLLRQITESAVREAIGNVDLDTALNRRDTLTPQIRELVQGALDRFGTGLAVTQLGLPVAAPPAPVKAAFDDVIAAEQDAQRFQNEAQAYEGQVVPEARGQASRILAAAQGHRDAVIARAEGEAARFALLLDEYERSPQVVRQRLYLETMQEVMTRNPRVLLGSQGNTLLLQMPGGAAAPPAPVVAQAAAQAQAAAATETPRPPRAAERPVREGSR
ncbi:MAG: FtsH protease activity modulator HflK [Xanthomonadaceae bacterium]|jgi:membrane protease subunit HflK|nr:FtsH protease activity modulator HflK [Xanthomonadaceae bacterium]